MIGESPISYKVHFLYVCSSQYALIKRKIARYEAGKSVRHLLRHQQNLLTDDEFDQRIQALKKELIEFIYKPKGE